MARCGPLLNARQGSLRPKADIGPSPQTASYALIRALAGGTLTDERVERRLAAVLAADVAGYSRIMGSDEEGTLARLKAVRKALVDPVIASHRGRIVKTTGDGILAEFASAVDAVRGAVELQRGMAQQSASVPQDQRIEFRIGIHIGDIIIDDNDIFGDGVNVAARLEGIAGDQVASAYPTMPIDRYVARSRLAATTSGSRT